jgi:hypothetical protein
MARETPSPGIFTSSSFIEQELHQNFLLANVAYRHRSLFLRCKQGKRAIQDSVMELQNPEAAMIGAPLSENVMCTSRYSGRHGVHGRCPYGPRAHGALPPTADDVQRCGAFCPARRSLYALCPGTCWFIR